MVGNFKTKRQEGFTIIEVLIVLAIAGLIMLIVFLAVPALQRNSRNTQRRNDISSLLGAAQEVINNNNGDLSKLTNANIVAAAPTPAYYKYSTSAPLMPADATKVTTAAVVQTNNNDVDTVSIYYQAKCSGGDYVQGTTRQIAIVYSIESSATGGKTAQCTNS